MRNAKLRTITVAAGTERPAHATPAFLFASFTLNLSLRPFGYHARAVQPCRVREHQVIEESYRSTVKVDWPAPQFPSLRTPTPSRETVLPCRSCIPGRTSWQLSNRPQRFADRWGRNPRGSTDPHDDFRPRFQTEIQIAPSNQRQRRSLPRPHPPPPSPPSSPPLPHQHQPL